MLTTCPECELQISDKALVCPHCGFPLKKNAQVYPRKANKRRRLPNGFGQISEIKGRNLRKPFRVLVTVDKTQEGRPICKPLQPQSYFETYNDAYLALIEYNKNPYSLESSITMQELFEKWQLEHSKNVSEGTIRKNLSEWRYLRAIHHLPLNQVRTPQLKYALDNATTVDVHGDTRPLPRTGKARAKNILNQIYDYALSNELVPQNYARSFALPKEDQEAITHAETPHINYTGEELLLIQSAMESDPSMEILYIQLYSGWRPNEILALKLENVNLDERWIKGGSKTDAGKNRIVPIHHKILDIVTRNYHHSKSIGNEYLFTAETTSTYHRLYYTYHRYHLLFTKAKDQLGLNPEHRPHDGRVYFATAAKKAGVDEYALKLMMGHTIKDVTESKYVRRDPEWLLTEIEKIK